MTSLALIISFISLFGYSFTVPDSKKECLTKIQNIYKQLYDKAKTADKNEVCYLNYKVTILSGKKKSIPLETTVEIFSGKEKRAVISNQIETYSDENASVNVIPYNKTVYINPGIKKDDKTIASDLKKQMLIQDSIFQYCEVQHYGPERQKNGEVIQKAILKISEKGIKKLHVVSMVFCFNKTLEQINEITYYYDNKSPIKEMKLKINEYVYNYKTSKLDEPALAMVLNKNNTLLNKYKGYRLIDNRKKKELTEVQKKLAANTIKKLIATKK